MATFTNASKNSSTFRNFLRHGSDTVLRELENTKFTDVIFADGTILKDVTFNDLANQIWTNLSKNSSTFTNTTKN